MSKNKYTSTQHTQIIKVEASAGSGKTRELAKQYIRLLYGSGAKESLIPLQTILAVTFTNKATVEMKERILEFLKRIAFDSFADDKERQEMVSAFKVNAHAIQIRAADFVDSIIRHYDFFQIQTIDSFINTILTGTIFKVNRSVGFRIVENSHDYLAYSLDMLIEQSNSSKSLRKLFEDFIHHYLYIKDNPSWIPKRDMLAHIEELYDRNNTFGGVFQPSSITDREVLTIKQEVGRLLTQLWELRPEGTNKVFERTLERLITRKRFTANDFKKTFQKEHFPITKKYEVPAHVDELWKSLQKAISCFCDKEALALYNPYINIFNTICDLLEERAQKDDVIFLEELNKRIRSLFEEGIITIPELYCRSAPHLKHFLIDEFQDTSELQWNNLYSIIDEALSQGGSFFYVGDKKQAIYQFRGGEARLFDEVPHFLSHYQTDEKYLPRNYRSEKEIVHFINTVFAPDNLQNCIKIIEAEEEALSLSSQDIAEIVDIFKCAEQDYLPKHDAGYVAMNVVAGGDSGICKETIFNTVLTILRDVRKRGYTYNDIGILTRSNDDVEALTELLLEAGIDVVSDKTLTIKQNRCIKDIISFLTFLDSPIDNLAFAAFILSDLFLKATSMKREVVEEFIFSLQFDTNKSYYYIAFRKAFPQVWENYIEKEFFKKVGILPLYEFVRQVFEVFHIFENFPVYHAFFMRFLELIKEEESEYSSVRSFLDYFDSLRQDDRRMYVSIAESGDAVNILTYHKAKGLEFGVVIIPFLSFYIKPDKCIIQKDNGKDGETLRITHLLKGYTQWSEDLRMLYRRAYKKMLIAELNTLYVALTRARSELYTFVPERIEGKKINRYQHIVANVKEEWGQKRRGPRTSKKDIASHALHLQVSTYKPWDDLLRAEFIDVSEIVNRQSILRGEILHYFLAGLGNIAGNDCECLLKEARRMTSIEFTSLVDLDEYEECVRALVYNEQLRNLFTVPNGEVFVEKELVNRYGETKRVDRLIVTEEEIVIVDYKSSREGGDSYKAQMKEYMRVMGDIYPKKKVKGYLLYMDTASLEEVHLT